MDKQLDGQNPGLNLIQGYPSAYTTLTRLVRKEEEGQKDEGTSMPDTQFLLLYVQVSCVFCCSGD